MDLIIITDEEKEVIRELRHGLYTVDFLEEWINRKDNVEANCIAALQAMGAKGYFQAIKMIVKQKQNTINE